MTVHAICDLDPKRLAEHEAEYHPRYVTAAYRRVLQDSEVDFVIIGTKQDLHARLIRESLAAGKWVMCKKPMAETVEESRLVLEAERQARRRPGHPDHPARHRVHGEKTGVAVPL